MASRKRIPKYRLHKPSGRAVVTIHGHDHYLGVHGTPESHRAYDRLIARMLAGTLTEPASDLTVDEVLAGYWRHAESLNYDHRHLDRIKRALGVARDLYGPEPVEQFRGRALKAVQQAMVQRGWCRRVINQRIDCIKAAFRWALSEELVSADTCGSVRAVSSLLKGRTTARESIPVKPVPAEHLAATLPYLPPYLADAVRLQLLTASRPGEVLALHALELDMSRDVWLFNLGAHKTAWRGHRRLVLVGPRGQEIVRQYLRRPCACGQLVRGTVCLSCGAAIAGEVVLGDYYLFDPSAARQERFAAMRAKRKTPVQPSQVDRSKARPKRPPGQRYRVSSYGAAITRACAKAGVPGWAPHMIRHSAASEIRKEFGITIAQTILGHASLQATEVYAEQDIQAAMDAMRKRG